MKKKLFLIALLLVFALISCGGEEENKDENNGASGGKNKIWEISWGTDNWERPLSIAASEEMVFVGGETKGNLYSDLYGKFDAFLSVFTNDGKELWGKQWGTSIDDSINLRALMLDENQNVYGAVDTWHKGSGSMMVKFSPNGEKIWENIVAIDAVSFIAKDVFGNIYIAGNHGDILKYTKDGEELWKHNISTENTEAEIKSIVVDSQGNIYVGGRTNGDLFEALSGSYDAFLVKLNPDLVHVFEKQWGTGNNNDWIQVSGLAVDNNNNLYIASSSSSEESDILVKYSPNGEKIWGQNNKDGSYYSINSISIDNENIIYLSCTNGEIYKYNQDGFLIWNSKDIVKVNWEIKGMTLDNHQNLYLIGGESDNYLMKIPKSEMK